REQATEALGGAEDEARAAGDLAVQRPDIDAGPGRCRSHRQNNRERRGEHAAFQHESPSYVSAPPGILVPIPPPRKALPRACKSPIARNIHARVTFPLRHPRMTNEVRSLARQGRAHGGEQGESMESRSAHTQSGTGQLARSAMAYVLAGGRGSRLMELTD